MANKEQDYEPQAKPADEVTKQCQEFIRLYPTRWALTDSAFEKIKNTVSRPPGLYCHGDGCDCARIGISGTAVHGFHSSLQSHCLYKKNVKG